MKDLYSRILIGIGIILILYAFILLWQRHNPTRLSFDTKQITKQSTQSKKEVKPVEITLKKEHIDLPIVPSHISHGVWETTTQGASYLADSPVPGDKGNSILYAHNWTNLFGSLVMTIPGDEVTIRMSDNSTRSFIVKYTSIVTPDAVDILKPSNDNRITLYTCTGFLDSHRFVAVAIRNDAQKTISEN